MKNILLKKQRLKKIDNNIITNVNMKQNHIHLTNSKVIRYIGYNFVTFLHGKCLESNQGVTYNLKYGTTVQ